MWVSWDGRKDSGELAASGVYIYTLAAEGFTQSRKFMLLRHGRVYQERRSVSTKFKEVSSMN